MAKLTTAEMIEAIKELSVLELNELVKACRRRFGVLQQQVFVVAAASWRRSWKQQKRKMSST